MLSMHASPGSVTPYSFKLQIQAFGLKATMRMLWPIIANSVTLPYYRFYRQNTLLPILALARRVGHGDNDYSISERLRHWQGRKLDEFKFVATAVCECVLFRTLFSA